MSQTRFATLLLLVAAALTSPLSAQKKTKVDFQKQIYPILEKSCIECHRATYVDKNGRRRRPKGKVMLDTLANIKKSKRGKLFIAGKPDDSLVMETITLPADDEDRMPPPKKGGPLPQAQIDLIKRWIDEGADYGKWTGEDDKAKSKPKTGKGKPKTRPSKIKPKAKSGPSPLVTLSRGLRPLPAATLQRFADTPFMVKSVGDGNPLLTVSCAGRTDDVDDNAVQMLLPLKDHITDLDLSRSRVGDGCCAAIAKMPRLTSLDLRQTGVGNAGVKLLGACGELRRLNLFDTRTGDYALLALAGLKKLEKLYLWQTDTSAKAVVKLREQLPRLEVVFSAALPEPSDAASNGRRR